MIGKNSRKKLNKGLLNVKVLIFLLVTFSFVGVELELVKPFWNSPKWDEFRSNRKKTDAPQIVKQTKNPWRAVLLKQFGNVLNDKELSTRPNKKIKNQVQTGSVNSCNNNNNSFVTFSSPRSLPQAPQLCETESKSLNASSPTINLGPNFYTKRPSKTTSDNTDRMTTGGVAFIR